MTYPKVLIFGQPFNNFSGGGITLTNLFRNWPKEKIAVTFIGHGLLTVTTDVCDTYYQLGSEEHRWVFPLNLIQRKFRSGLKSFDNKSTPVPANIIQQSIRYKIVNNLFYPFLRWIGVFHSVSKISLSERFKSWLKDFKPDVLYIQAATRETILFATELCDYLNIPAVIHVMDDWPSAISSKGLFRRYWASRIDREFRQLLGKADLHLSICDEMSAEYLKRYDKPFVAFHNPIDLVRWSDHIKSNFEIDPGNVKILYSGRIGDNGVGYSLLEFAEAVDSINGNGLKIKLHIQTPSRKSSLLKALEKFTCVVINPFVKYDEVPKTLGGADILLIANDFDSQGVKYLRFSMPTKASEYMISGTPVIVYSPGETAVSNFFRMNNCGMCITKKDPEEIGIALKQLISNEEYRKVLSMNAVSIAREKFDAIKVRDRFQELIKTLPLKPGITPVQG